MEKTANVYLDKKLIYEDIPFPLAQLRVKELITKENIKKDRFKITYFKK